MLSQRRYVPTQLRFPIDLRPPSAYNSSVHYLCKGGVLKRPRLPNRLGFPGLIVGLLGLSATALNQVTQASPISQPASGT